MIPQIGKHPRHHGGVIAVERSNRLGRCFDGSAHELVQHSVAAPATVIAPGGEHSSASELCLEPELSQQAALAGAGLGFDEDRSALPTHGLVDTPTKYLHLAPAPDHCGAGQIALGDPHVGIGRELCESL